MATILICIIRKMTKIENVLFLCSGNSCRSVYAEYYAKWLKSTSFKEELRDVNFDSVKRNYEMSILTLQEFAIILKPHARAQLNI